MSTGACMPLERVWWVDSSAAPGGDGSEAEPYQTINQALANMMAGQEGTIFVADGGGIYPQVQIAGGFTVAIRGVETPLFQSGADAFVVTGNAVVFVDNVAISNGAARGVSCAGGGQLWLDGVRISNNAGRGILIDGCAVTIRDSYIWGNGQTGLYLLDGQVAVSNSMISALSPSVSALQVVEGPVLVGYSTLASGGIGAAAMSCMNDSVGSQVRNSIIVSLDMSAEILAVAAQAFRAAHSRGRLPTT